MSLPASLSAHAVLVAGVGVEFADVVQQRSADGEVAVDPGQNRGGCGRGVSDLQRMLEQPCAVRVVVVLGGERPAERAPGVRGRAEERFRQGAEVGVMQAVEERVELHARVRRRAWRVRESAGPSRHARGGVGRGR